MAAKMQALPYERIPIRDQQAYDRVEVTTRENMKFIQKYWLTGGMLPVGKRTLGRAVYHQLPSGEITITNYDWDQARSNRYETFL